MSETAEKGPDGKPKDNDVDNHSLDTPINQFDRMLVVQAAQAKELYNFFGGRILEHTTSQGDVLAIKVKSTLRNPEGDTTDYAATHGGMSIIGPFDGEREFDEWCLARPASPRARCTVPSGGRS